MISNLKFAAYYLPVFCFVNFSLEFFHRHIFIAGRLIPYRMESRYDFFYHLNDVRTVFVTCLCQFCQLSEEFTDIKRNWFADMDQIIIGFLHSLFCHQLLFVKLLTRT